MVFPDSVAESPLFGVAPDWEVRSPGADSGSDQIGSAPTPDKKGQLQLPLHTLKFLILKK